MLRTINHIPKQTSINSMIINIFMTFATVIYLRLTVNLHPVLSIKKFMKNMITKSQQLLCLALEIIGAAKWMESKNSCVICTKSIHKMKFLTFMNA